jgi:hypothetical protein
MSLGRNDPCHCGSGKKYKKCHLAEDERAERKERIDERFSEMDEDELKTLVQFSESRVEIERALKQLERHRSDFEKLLEDEAALTERANRLFSEPMFEPLWFNPEELADAIEPFGSLDSIPEAEGPAKALEAIQSIATKDKRRLLGTRLLLLLPNLVAAKRFEDAWIVQLSAVSMIEDHRNPNEFLMTMFRQGMERWARLDEELEREQLQAIGLTRERLDSMSMEEVDRWAESLRADPARCADLEAQLRSRVSPEAVDRRIQHAEMEALRFIEEEELLQLLPTRAEAEEWGSLLHQGFLTVLDKYPEVPAPIPDDHPAAKEISTLIWDTSSEMASALFTLERLQELVAAFRKVRNEKFVAGDKKGAACLGASLALFERVTTPGENPFLIQLCCSGIRYWARVSSEEQQAALSITQSG